MYYGNKKKSRKTRHGVYVQVCKMKRAKWASIDFYGTKKKRNVEKRRAVLSVQPSP